jgi:hypothetical protein
MRALNTVMCANCDSVIRFALALGCAPVPHAHAERSAYPRADADHRRAERPAERRRSDV